METLKRIADLIQGFVASPSLASGADMLAAIITFAWDYVGLIIFAIIGISIWKLSKKFKAAESLAKTGFKGVIVSKAFVDKKKQTIRVMGLNINGIGLGDMVAFDKDPFQTKCKVGVANLIADDNAVEYSSSFSTGTRANMNSRTISLTDLFKIAKKGIQAMQETKNSGSANAPLLTITNEDQNGNVVPFSPSQDMDVKFTAKPAPVSNEMIVLEFSNPTEFSRLVESQAIGQGNTKVLKAKDLKLVLREKAKVPVASAK